jgi:hypothetical protein
MCTWAEMPATPDYKLWQQMRKLRGKLGVNIRRQWLNGVNLPYVESYAFAIFTCVGDNIRAFASRASLRATAIYVSDIELVMRPRMAARGVFRPIFVKGAAGCPNHIIGGSDQASSCLLSSHLCILVRVL